MKIADVYFDIDGNGEVKFNDKFMNELHNVYHLDVLQDIIYDCTNIYNYLMKNPKKSVNDYINDLPKDSPHFTLMNNK